MAKFFKCESCDNVFTVLKDGNVPPFCCGEKMTLLEPNTVDAATEKHVPVVEVQRDGHVLRVSVGEVAHPMLEEHYIEWIALEADGRLEIHHLKPSEKPVTIFAGAEHGNVYAYCNLHGLWTAEF